MNAKQQQKKIVKDLYDLAKKRNKTIDAQQKEIDKLTSRLAHSSEVLMGTHERHSVTIGKLSAIQGSTWTTRLKWLFTGVK